MENIIISAYENGTYEIGEDYIMSVDIANPNTSDHTVISIVKKLPDGTVEVIDAREIKMVKDKIDLGHSLNKIAEYYKNLKNEE